MVAWCRVAWLVWLCSGGRVRDAGSGARACVRCVCFPVRHVLIKLDKDSRVHPAVR